MRSIVQILLAAIPLALAVLTFWHPELWGYLPHIGRGLLMALGVITALLLVAFMVPIIPGVIPALVNRPNRYRPEDAGEECTTRDYPPSKFGFFTYLYQGQEKMIERGGRFIRGIMAFDHHRHKGEAPDSTLSPRQAEYWEVEQTPDGESDSHPIPFPIRTQTWYRALYFPLSIGWWAWKRWVYKWTGAVFTGIYPFQTVKVYPMERSKRVQLADGTAVLERIEDYSDHYRVAHFQFPIIVPESDTKDKLSVRTTLNAIGRVFNAFLAAYNTDDDWPTRYAGEITSEVTAYTRPRPLDMVLSAKDEAEAREMSTFITANATKQLEQIGIAVVNTQVQDISPSSKSVKETIDDEAKASIEQRADEKRAVGKAAYIKEAAKASKEADGLSLEGLALARIQADVSIAQAAGPKGNLVVINGGKSDPDPTKLAILHQLKRLQPQEAET